MIRPCSLRWSLDLPRCLLARRSRRALSAQSSVSPRPQGLSPPNTDRQDLRDDGNPLIHQHPTHQQMTFRNTGTEQPLLVPAFTDLPPVVDLRGRLFVGNHSRPWWYDFLTTRAQALGVNNLQWRAKAPHTVDSTCEAPPGFVKINKQENGESIESTVAIVPSTAAFNQIVARLKHFDVDVRAENIMLAIGLAVDHPVAMKQYLAMWRAAPDTDKHELLRRRADSFGYIANVWRPFLIEKREAISRRARRVAQMLHLLTGRHSRGGSKEGEPREPCLYEFMVSSQWAVYIRLVEMAAGREIGFQ